MRRLTRIAADPNLSKEGQTELIKDLLHLLKNCDELIESYDEAAGEDWKQLNAIRQDRDEWAKGYRQLKTELLKAEAQLKV